MNSWFQWFLLSLVFRGALLKIILPPEGEKFEGDLIVSQKLISYANGTTNEKREYHSSTFLWQKDRDIVTIPYTVNSVLGSAVRENLKIAFAAFKSLTCIEFIPRQDQNDYIEFTDENQGCASPIGRQKGKQNLYLGSGCGSLSTILHEMMHAIGFLHEQSREDRDEHVGINWENIQDDKMNQFQMYSLNFFGYEYDEYSLMHYRKTSFSKNGLPTIYSKIDEARILGNEKFFTKIDVKQINTLYNCPELKLDDYVIKIYTSNKWFAATGATAYMEIKGEGTDSSGEFKAGKGFDADSEVNLERFIPNMSVKKLTVRHDNTGIGPGWHLDKIVLKIKSKTTGTTKVLNFHCYCWVEGTGAKVLTP